jgi:hypothetical protein
MRRGEPVTFLMRFFCRERTAPSIPGPGVAHTQQIMRTMQVCQDSLLSLVEGALLTFSNRPMGAERQLQLDQSVVRLYIDYAGPGCSQLDATQRQIYKEYLNNDNRHWKTTTTMTLALKHGNDNRHRAWQ